MIGAFGDGTDDAPAMRNLPASASFRNAPGGPGPTIVAAFGAPVVR